MNRAELVWKTELRRGLVELCILSVLHDQEAYGYQIVEQLKNDAQLEFSESTVYPVLARLYSQKLVTDRKVKSDAGPPRRYFRLTSTGKNHLRNLVQQWRLVSQQVNHLIPKEIRDDDGNPA